jgi:squalene-hopene/tetraprenyl-beta-curcumene cyclase
LDRSQIEHAWENACKALLSRSGSEGWRGQLSSSAIATAVGVAALHFADAAGHADAIRRALDFLLSDQNADGGWGDSPESPSNLAATLLAWSALNLAPTGDADAAEEWLRRTVGGLTAAEIGAALAARYGNDRTFAAPILMFATACGRFGSRRDAWADVYPLPFELAAAPSVLWKWLRLSVVSYGLPALIAVGLARHRNRPTRNPITRCLRNLCERRVLRLCESMQPSNGGFEEAAPLTGFVAVGLTVAGHGHHDVVKRCVAFLVNGQREDGSWPIDTDLATWVTTLSINALAEHPAGSDALTPERRASILKWILGQQHAERHPLTYTEPGGWAWSDLEGAMPDADDTPGVMMAIRRLAETPADHRDCVEAAANWLMSIQNCDGGMPTFNKGWGKLPFDRSCPDLTSHVLRAFCEWRGDFSEPMAGRTERSARRMLKYLVTSQRTEGSWVPLWFGNQYTGKDQTNRIYGTAQTVIALKAVQDAGYADVATSLERACEWLGRVQQDDGSWGSDEIGQPASIEETALAVRALIAGGEMAAAERGIAWLLRETREGTYFPPAPIGLYFAVLFYSETMYPLVWTISALGAWLRIEETGDFSCSPAQDSR